MFTFKLNVQLDDGGPPSLVDLEQSDISTVDGDKMFGFVDHTLGKDNVRCQDAVVAGARGLVGVMHASGKKITQVQVIRVTSTEETLETFTQAP